MLAVRVQWTPCCNDNDSSRIASYVYPYVIIQSDALMTYSLYTVTDDVIDHNSPEQCLSMFYSLTKTPQRYTNFIFYQDRHDNV